MGVSMNWAVRAARRLNLTVFRSLKPGLRRRLRRLNPAWVGEKGVTFIEIVIMSLIMTIALVAITKAIQVASQGALAAKERARALALARDKLEEVKNMGYEQMKVRLSNYYYPDQPDPSNPLHQLSSIAPYPTTKPTASQDPWTPEAILVGKIYYWRHVVVKFVEEDTATKQLVQKPEPAPPTVVGGTNAASNLAYIEVDVTWYSRRTTRMEQVRVSTLLANQSVHEFALGQISGTIYDDDADDDLVDKPPAESGLPPPPAYIPGTDDVPITWASLVVIARNVVTGDTFTTMSDKGAFRITSMPEGDYLVRVAGAPAYLDSYYTGETSGPYTLNPAVNVMQVSITAADPNQRRVNIWTIKTKKGRIKGRYSTANVAPATHRIRISCNDGVSEPLELTVDPAICSTGCYFSISNIAFPSSGAATYQVRIADLDTNQSATAYICMDLWAYNVAATDFYLGIPMSMPTPYCGSCNLFPDCTRTATPYNADDAIPLTQTATASIVRVRMKETDNTGALINLSKTWLGRIRVTYTPLSGMGSPFSQTQTIDSGTDIGATKFSLPGGPASKVEFQAYMGDQFKTTTGYTTDTYFLPFELDAPTYDLEPGGSYSANPAEENRHLFVVTRISTVSGTVWEILNSKGFAGAQVNIRNDSTKWSTVVTSDGNGRFVATEVPVDDMLYTVEPVVGVDYISDPISITDLEVSAPGLVYLNSKFGVPLAFTLNAINGLIKGEVTVGAGGPVVDSGALVIASTYNSGTSQFVSSLPSASLVGKYTYSTVTMTDGTYQLKTATGAAFNYYIYCSAVVNGVQKFYKSAAVVTPVADTEVIHNIALP